LNFDQSELAKIARTISKSLSHNFQNFAQNSAGPNAAKSGKAIMDPYRSIPKPNRLVLG